VPLGVIESKAAARPAWELFDRIEGTVLGRRARSRHRRRSSPAAPPRERPWWRGIVWLSRGHGGRRPYRRTPAFAGWQRTWLAVAEASSFVAGSCERGGFHAAGDAVVRDGELGASTADAMRAACAPARSTPVRAAPAPRSRSSRR
jgi:hypothetical protein